MFYYWDGYEIDGSDTDFDLVLPETYQRIDFVKCFLAMPILQQPVKMGFWTDKGEMQEITVQDIIQQIIKGEETHFCVNCGLIEQFPPNIRDKVYSFSSTREPLEANYKKKENPCTEPQIPTSIGVEGISLFLTVLPPGTKKEWYTSAKTELQGYVRNPELFGSHDDLPCFTLNCGPGFYYEYAMYIMDYLQEHFPGMAITGGLDCANGWTEGCTYAASIYSHERIHIPVTYSVRNTLKYLTQYDLLRSYKSSYRKGKWVCNLLDDFLLVNPAGPETEMQRYITFGDYADRVEKVLRDCDDEFQMIVDTAIHILLPGKELFNKNPEAIAQLTKVLKDVKDPEYEYHYHAWFAFTRTADKVVGEYRVRQEMKPYMLALLELAGSGEIEFIKEETYRRRQHD